MELSKLIQVAIFSNFVICGIFTGKDLHRSSSCTILSDDQLLGFSLIQLYPFHLGKGINFFSQELRTNTTMDFCQQ